MIGSASRKFDCHSSCHVLWPSASASQRRSPARTVRSTQRCGPFRSGVAIEQSDRVGVQLRNHALGDRIVAELLRHLERLEPDAFGLLDVPARAASDAPISASALATPDVSPIFRYASSALSRERHAVARGDAERIEHALEKIGFGLPVQAIVALALVGATPPAA